jgi:hypothetical protein
MRSGYDEVVRLHPDLVLVVGRLSGAPEREELAGLAPGVVGGPVPELEHVVQHVDRGPHQASPALVLVVLVATWRLAVMGLSRAAAAIGSFGTRRIAAVGA